MVEINGNQNHDSRQKFLQNISEVSALLLFTGCSDKEDSGQSDEKIMVLNKNRQLVEVNTSDISPVSMQTDTQYLKKKGRTGVTGRKFVMVIGLAKYKSAHQCMKAGQGAHHMKLHLDIEDGKIKFGWISVSNPSQNTENTNHWLRVASGLDNFIVYGESYPGILAKVSYLILPSAMIFEKWGAYGNAEHLIQHWKQQVTPVGKAIPGIRQYAELSKRFKLCAVWGVQEILGLDGGLPDVLPEISKLGYNPNSTLYEVLFTSDYAKSFEWLAEVGKEVLNTKAEGDKRNVLDADGKAWMGYGSLFKNIYGKNTIVWN